LRVGLGWSQPECASEGRVWTNAAAVHPQPAPHWRPLRGAVIVPRLRILKLR